MNDPVCVRELMLDERPVADKAKTGDKLPDGSVLLWQEDINRMGLRALRSLLFQKVIQENSTVAVGSGSRGLRLHSPHDEII